MHSLKENNGDILELWEKVDSVLLRNFKDHWIDPLVNKYLGHNASDSYEGYLLIRKVGKPIWISHPFNYPQAKKVFQNALVLNYQKKEDLLKILKKYAGKKIGFNGSYISYSSVKAFKKLLKGKKLIDVTNELENSREIKTTEEMKRIKKAVTVTQDAIDFIKKNLKAGKTELEVVQEFKSYFERNNMKTAFCIVAFGKNTSHIHYDSGKTKLTKNTPVLIDVGAFCEGYCSDLSESFWFGNPIGKEYNAYSKALTAVKTAQHEIEKILAPQLMANKLYTTATKYVGKLPHAIGHGIGIEVHDMPSGIGEKSTWKLKEGMVIAIEPAIYTKSFGIRLEKNYLITKKGMGRL